MQSYAFILEIGTILRKKITYRGYLHTHGRSQLITYISWLTLQLECEKVVNQISLLMKSCKANQDN